MLTKKIANFSDDLLNTVRGILGEEKKCSADCECPKCEAEEMKEGSMPTADEPTDANKKTADKVRAMMAKEKKPVKEEIEDMVNEAADGLADKAKKSGVSLSTLKKVYARGIAAWNSGHRPGTTPQQWAHARVNSYITKGKGTYHGADKDLRSEGTDMPFEKPYKKVADRKDEYGNTVKNVAKHLAKKAMNKQKNEEVESIDEAKYFVSTSGREHHVHEKIPTGKKDALGQALMTSKVVKKFPYGDSQSKQTSSDQHKAAYAHAKKLNASLKNEEAEHNNCGTPECCGQCDTAEQIDELSKEKMGRYINKAKDSIDTASYRQGHKEAHGSSSKPLEKKLTKRHKGIETAVKKLTKEESEQIDELSKDTMGRYINKAATKMGSQGVTAGLKIAADEKSSKNFKDMGKREKGIKLAVSKLTKEEQDFIDSLNDADIEQIDELSVVGLDKYHKKAYQSMFDKDSDKKTVAKRKKGMDTAYNKAGFGKAKVYATEESQIDELSNKTLKTYVGNAYNDYVKKSANRMPGEDETDAMKKRKKSLNLAHKKLAKEEAEITEARGRPRKAGAKDFTIHPKTKEKLMHNNPADMARIERLQKNGILEKPKVEAGQHIMNQLRKAKTSMLGGSKINFTHGDSKEVSGTHAAKILTKYAGMRPNEKEDFQKFVGHSHENLMKHV